VRQASLGEEEAMYVRSRRPHPTRLAPLDLDSLQNFVSQQTCYRGLRASIMRSLVRSLEGSSDGKSLR